jgi:hypothetical protein
VEEISYVLDNETLETFTAIQCQNPEESIPKRRHMVISHITNWKTKAKLALNKSLRVGVCFVK